MRVTKGFVQLGHDVEAIIGSAYPSVGSGHKVGQFPKLHKASNVSGILKLLKLTLSQGYLIFPKLSRTHQGDLH